MWQSNPERKFQNFSLQKETSRTSSTLGFQYVKVCDFEFFESARAECRAEFSKFSAPQETLRTSGNLGILYLTNLSRYFSIFEKILPKTMKSPFLAKNFAVQCTYARPEYDRKDSGGISTFSVEKSYIYIY